MLLWFAALQPHKSVVPSGGGGGHTRHIDEADEYRHRRRIRANVHATTATESGSRVRLRMNVRVAAEPTVAIPTSALSERFNLVTTSRTGAQVALVVDVPVWSLEEDAILAAAYELLLTV